MAKLVGDPQMQRLSIRLPKSTLDELNSLAVDSGMYQTYFYQAAVIVGARRLWQLFQGQMQLLPMKDEASLSPMKVVEEMTMREKAERLKSTRVGRSRKRSRALDYMDGILGADSATPLDSGDNEEE